MALRLSTDEREQFLKKYKTTLFEAYGAVMKEYVTVPQGRLAPVTLRKHSARMAPTMPQSTLAAQTKLVKMILPGKSAAASGD